MVPPIYMMDFLGIFMNMDLFYCATVAYHVELNAISGGRRHPAKFGRTKCPIVTVKHPSFGHIQKIYHSCR